MKKLSTQLFFPVALLTFFVCTTSSVFAAYERVAPGATITIGEFVYDDDYVATTTPCTVSIYDTAGTLKVNAASMTSNANGWHYYDYAVGGSETPGSWPAFISCGSVPAGDLIKQDKTFVVGNVIESTSTIATAVWDQPTRTLTDYATSSIASAAASSVWASGARTLTGFGTLVADIWSSGSRTLSGFGTLASDVWASATRTLTGAGLTSGSLATNSDIASATSSVITDVNSNTNSVVLTASTSLGAQVASLNNITAADVWASPTRSLTTFGTLVADTASGVWSSVSRTLTGAGLTSGNLATQSDITNTNSIVLSASTSLAAQIAGLNNISAADVWAAGTRTLTGAGLSSGSLATFSDVSAVKTKTDTIDWADVDSIVTTAGTIQAKTDTIDWANVSDIKTKTDTIAWADVTGIKTKTDTIVWGNVSTLLSEVGTGNISGIKTKTDTIDWTDVDSIVTTSGAIQLKTDTIDWANVTAIKAKTDTILWTDVTTIKNNVATLISEVGTGNISGIKTNTDTIDWTDVDGLVTSNGAIKAKTDTIAWADVTGIKTKTDTILWTDVTGIKTKTDTIAWGDVTTLLSEVGSGDIAAIKTKTDTIDWTDVDSIVTTAGTIQAKTDTIDWTNVSDIKTKTDTIAWADVTAVKLKTDTIAWADVTGIKTKTDTINWSNVSDIKTKTDTIDWADITALPASVATAVWSAGTRTLTGFGTLVADIWSSPTRRLSDATLSSGTLATTDEINTAVDALNDISAADVWAAGTRTLTDNATSSIAQASANAVWNLASSQLTNTGTVGKLLVDNLDAQVSSIASSSITAADIWSYSLRSLTDYATSSVAQAASAAVWSNATRSLTNYGNDITAQNVWDVLASSLTSVDSIGKLLADNVNTTVGSRASETGQLAGFKVTMSDYSSVQAGSTYRARIQVLNGQSVPVDAASTPLVTLYDASRNIVVSSVPMTDVGAGLYEYTYSVSSSASQGVWEALVSTEVESGKTITTNDYWIVAGSPAQVIINSVNVTSAPTVSANLTITNEGLAGYEYQYEWCVVSGQTDACGGGDDVYHGTGAKYINPGDDFNTNLTANVPTAGSYYFKVVVYFGTERSGSSRSFTIAGSGGSSSSSGSGGGGSNSKSTTCKGADFNGDKKVDSIDFSILLAFWKTASPFANKCVDTNKDSKVDSIDFSILLSQWGTSGTSINIKK